MKGIVFTEFLEMVEDAYGLTLKDKIITAAKLPNDGAYTSVGSYDHQQLIALVGQLSAVTGTPVRDLLVAFGEHLLQRFSRDFGQFFAESKSCFDFLGRIQGYIHVEVRKLYPDAELPSFRYLSTDSGMMVMEYQSARPFAAFAEGLIRGAIKHYGENITLRVEDVSGGGGTAARFYLQKNA